MSNAADAWSAGMTKVAEGGAMTLHIIRLPDAYGLLAQATRGDAYATGLICAVNDFMDNAADRASTAEPVLCLCCDALMAPPFSDDIAVCIIVPEVAWPTVSVGMGLCGHCALGSGLQDRLTARLQIVWPGIRSIEILHAAGHA